MPLPCAGPCREHAATGACGLDRAGNPLRLPATAVSVCGGRATVAVVGENERPMYTTSTAVLEALEEAGVDCLFANFGSDHTGLIEAIAAAREQGHRIPNVIAVPAEMVALSAAHGHAQLSGRAQAVLVHVD